MQILEIKLLHAGPFIKRMILVNKDQAFSKILFLMHLRMRNLRLHTAVSTLIPLVQRVIKVDLLAS